MEKIEQASEYYAHNYFDMHETNNYKALKEGFIAGAKWQQERSYSEEDLKEAFKYAYTIGFRTSIFDVTLKQENCDEWFELFKNK